MELNNIDLNKLDEVWGGSPISDRDDSPVKLDIDLNELNKVWGGGDSVATIEDELLKAEEQVDFETKLADAWGGGVGGTPPSKEDRNALVRGWLGVKQGAESFKIMQSYNDARKVKDPVARQLEIDLANKNYEDHQKKWAQVGDLGFAGEAGNLIGGMGTGYKQALPYVAAGVGTAVGVGTAIPGPFDEIATIPFGASKGLQAGSTVAWKKYGSGEMYRNMISEGVEHELADPIADKVGWVYAGIESLQMMPGASKIAGQTVGKILLGATKAYGRNILGEVTEEGLQAVTVEMATDLAKLIADPDVPIAMLEWELLKNAEKYAKAFGSDAIAAIPAMMLFAGPGVAVDTKGAFNEKARIQEERKKEAPLTEEEANQPGVDDFFTRQETVDDYTERLFGPDFTEDQARSVEDGMMGLQEKEPEGPLAPGAEDFFRAPPKPKTGAALERQLKDEYTASLRDTIEKKIQDHPATGEGFDLGNELWTVPENQIEEVANNIDEILADADIEAQSLMAKDADIVGKRDVRDSIADPIQFIREALPTKPYAKGKGVYEKRRRIYVAPSKRTGKLPGEFEDFSSAAGIGFTTKKYDKDGTANPQFDEIIDRYNNTFNTELTESDVVERLREIQEENAAKKRRRKSGAAPEKKISTQSQVKGEFNSLVETTQAKIRAVIEGKYTSEKAPQTIETDITAPQQGVQLPPKADRTPITAEKGKLNIDPAQRVDQLRAEGLEILRLTEEAAQKGERLNEQFDNAAHQIRQSYFLGDNFDLKMMIDTTKKVIEGADAEFIKPLIKDLEAAIDSARYILETEQERNRIREDRLKAPKSTKQSYRQVAEKYGIQFSGLDAPTYEKTYYEPPQAVKDKAEEGKMAFPYETREDLEATGPINGIVHPTYEQIAEARAKAAQLSATMGASIMKATSITDSFKRINAEATGEAIRTMQATILLGQEQAIARNKELGVSIKKINEQKNRDNLDIIMLGEGTLKAETNAEIEFHNLWTELMQESLDELKSAEVLDQGFYERTEKTLESDINKLHSEIQLIQSVDKVPGIDHTAKIKEKKEQIKIAEEAIAEIGALSEVPLNTVFTTIFEKRMDSKNATGKPFFENRASFASFRKIMGRKTLTFKSLVDEGLLDDNNIDAREIMSYYTAYYKEKIAQKKVIDAAKEDGIIIGKASKDKPTDFVPANKLMDVPGLKNMYIHKLFADYFQESFTGWKYKGKADLYLSRLFGTTKMLQFTNPIYMLIHDTYQQTMMGVITPKFLANLPKNLKLALRSMKLKDNSYYLAMEHGVFSVLMPNHFRNFQDQVHSAILKGDGKNPDLIRASIEYISSLKWTNPVNLIGDLYTVVHATTWYLDHTSRLLTFNHLISEGMTPAEAGKLAAIIHGDYADVPIATRRKINKFFFTPTYKIAMTRLYAHTLKSTYNQIKTKGKNKNMREQYLARGAILIPGLLIGKHMMATKVLGAETVEWSRKYAVPSETDNGIAKWVNVVFATPGNLPQRYWFRFFAKKPGDWNIFDRAIDSMIYELHPILQSLSRLSMNRDRDGRPIIIPYLDIHKNMLNFTRFIIRDTVRMTNLIKPTQSQSKRELKEAVKNSGKELILKVLRIYSFQYAGDPPAITTIKKIERELSRMERIIEQGHIDQDERIVGHEEEMQKNYLKMVERNTKDLYNK
jgi:hypothetical protein